MLRQNELTQVKLRENTTDTRLKYSVCVHDIPQGLVPLYVFEIYIMSYQGKRNEETLLLSLVRLEEY